MKCSELYDALGKQTMFTGLQKILLLDNTKGIVLGRFSARKLRVAHPDGSETDETVLLILRSRTINFFYFDLFHKLIIEDPEIMERDFWIQFADGDVTQGELTLINEEHGARQDGALAFHNPEFGMPDKLLKQFRGGRS
jgi:hypothetical protein